MCKRTEKLSNKVNDFHPTEDGEASEKSKGASDKSKLSLNGHLDIPIDLVIGQCVKVDLEEVQLSLFPD